VAKNRFKGKTCPYCAVPEITVDGDHVVCRQFFLEKQRGDLPKVAACRSCNGLKGNLEHYLTTVMPFGARHADATESLVTMGPKRLGGNLKLSREIAAGLEYGSPIDSSGQPSMTVPFDSEQLRQLYEMIARGLAWFHWALLLPPNTVNVHAWFASPEGTAIFDPLFALNSRHRITRSLGRAFLYEGAQARDNEHFTIWRMSLYGAVMADEHNTATQVGYVLTAPKTMAAANEFIRLSQKVREPKAA
jgi:hypothetical protein